MNPIVLAGQIQPHTELSRTKMANRSYLYAGNGLGHDGGSPEHRRITGISEWNYDIPLIYKILMSGNPRIVQSSIWVDAGNIAITSNYDLGVARLSQFLDRITLPEALELKQEALAFLAENRREDFCLNAVRFTIWAGRSLRTRTRNCSTSWASSSPRLKKRLGCCSPRSQSPNR
ncbi:MAG: hypothetical protein ACN6RK_03925 [Stenotrophomonas sp.]